MTLGKALSVLRKQDPVSYRNCLAAVRAVAKLRRAIRDEDPRDRASRTLEQMLGIR
jgi:hypothetical protein